MSNVPSSSSKTGAANVAEAGREEGPATDMASRVPANEHGGVFVGHQELADAFSMLDVENSGVITVSNLKKRLGVFFPDLSAKEYRFMMNNKKELSLDDLHELLDRNDIANFDPLEEAFKLYDADNLGYIDKARLRDVFVSYGFDDMTTADLDILVKAADVDGDGKITLDDFRKMLGGVDAVLEQHAVQKSA